MLDRTPGRVLGPLAVWGVTPGGSVVSRRWGFLSPPHSGSGSLLLCQSGLVKPAAALALCTPADLSAAREPRGLAVAWLNLLRCWGLRPASSSGACLRRGLSDMVGGRGKLSAAFFSAEAGCRGPQAGLGGSCPGSSCRGVHGGTWSPSLMVPPFVLVLGVLQGQ